ncbi:hypothetical protein J6590_043880 [Homalodisca vitripennis]|nr:hypothetical protein J6590_043880 [Homalodisca vitripennis]
MVPARWSDCTHSRCLNDSLTKTVPGTSQLMFWGCSMACPVSGSHCLWGYLKSKVFVTKPHTIADFKNCIRNKVVAIHGKMSKANFQKRLQTVWMLVGNIYVMLYSINDNGVTMYLL